MSEQGYLPIDGLPSVPRFGAVEIDPPWPEHGGGRRGAQNHYDLMSVEEVFREHRRLQDVGLLKWAEAAHLYVWVTNNYFRAGLDLVAYLGFRFIHPITWCKTSCGLGQYRRGQTEHCLFAVKGSHVENGTGARKPTLLGGKLLPPTGHSRKPLAIRDDIEHTSPGPYLELNCRNPRPGWWSYGTLDGPSTQPYLLGPEGQTWNKNERSFVG